MKNLKGVYVIITSFSVIIIFMVVFLVYVPLKEVQDYSNAIFLNKNRDIFLSLQDTQLHNFKNEHANYKPNLDKIDLLFIDPSNPVNFIEFLENIASEYNLSADVAIASSNVKKEQNSDDLPAIMFSVYVKGDFSNIIKFSEKLETGPYLVEIQNLKINRPEQKTEKVNNDKQVEFSLLIRAITR